MNIRILRPLAGLGILVLILLHASGRITLPGMIQMENSLYDMRLLYTAPTGVDPRVVIIDIDEKSLSRYGQWPWHRDLVARLTDTLFDEYQIEIFGLDVVFAEPDADPTLDALRKTIAKNSDEVSAPVRTLAEAASRDEQLAASFDRHAVVMGYVFRDGVSQPDIGLLPAPLFDKESGLATKTRAISGDRYTANLPVLQDERSGGFFSLFNGFDRDGIMRRVPLLNAYDGALYPSLSLAVARDYLGLGVEPVLAEGDRSGNYAALEALDLGLHQVTINQQAQVFVPYRQDPGFRYVAASDVLDRTVENPDDLYGTVALLGTSAAGLVDLRATPVSTVLPGVEVHANVITGLMDNSFLRAPGWSTAVEILILIAVGGLLALLLPMLSAAMMSIMAGLTFALGLGGNFYLWQGHQLILPLASFVVLVGAIYLINVLWGYFLESRSRVALKRSFGLYVPPEIIDNMQGQSMESLLRSEKKDMTVLFTDVRGFTTISEAMAPEDLSELMNRFLTPMTEIVHDHQGAIDKYMGDAMMAFWGAPLDTPNHASLALDAAVEMVRALDRLNPGFSERGWPQISIGVGLNSGDMNVGNMGSSFRMAYTVLGDAVNLGARLEGLTKNYGVPILISEFTAAGCPEYALCELDLVRVKGKREPIKIYTPLGLKDEIDDSDREFKSRFEDGLDHYRKQEWQEAQKQFTLLASRAGERAEFAQPAVRFYLERIGRLLANPPGDDWDGVYEFETK